MREIESTIFKDFWGRTPTPPQKNSPPHIKKAADTHEAKCNLKITKLLLPGLVSIKKLLRAVYATQGAYGPLTSLRTLLASTTRA